MMDRETYTLSNMLQGKDNAQIVAGIKNVFGDTDDAKIKRNTSFYRTIYNAHAKGSQQTTKIRAMLDIFLTNSGLSNDDIAKIICKSMRKDYRYAIRRVNAFAKLFSMPKVSAPSKSAATKTAKPKIAPKFPEPMKKDAHKHEIYELQQGLCIGCGKWHPETALQVDHNLPQSHEHSTNHFHNLQLMCQSCNASKGAQTLYEWKGMDWIRKIDDLIFEARIKKEGLVSREKYNKVSGDLQLAQDDLQKFSTK